jgi:hypothetical protein
MKQKYLLQLLVPFCFFCKKTSAQQDTLVFERNWKFPVQIEEVRENEIIYKRPDVLNSPRYSIQRRFITEIEYKDPADSLLKFRPTKVKLSRQLETWVTLSKVSTKITGVLHHVNDSTLMIRRHAKLLEKSHGLGTEVVYVFPYQDIHKIEVRRRNKMRQYAVWGAIGGLAAGTLTGLAIFKDAPPCDPNQIDGRICDESLFSPQTKWEKSLTLGFATGAVGFVGGGIAGSAKLTFSIGGQKDAFNRAIPKLEQMDLQSKR